MHGSKGELWRSMLAIGSVEVDSAKMLIPNMIMTLPESELDSNLVLMKDSGVALPTRCRHASCPSLQPGTSQQQLMQ